MRIKIGLVPYANTDYHMIMINDFAAGLEQVGFELTIANGPITDSELNDFVQLNSLNCIFAINRIPPKLSNRVNNFRFFSWFQDAWPEMVIDHNDLRKGDLIFTLGTRQHLGLELSDEFYGGTINLAINPSDFDDIETSQTSLLDLNCVGFIPIVRGWSDLYGYDQAPHHFLIKGYSYDDLEKTVLDYNRLKLLSNFSREISEASEKLVIELERKIKSYNLRGSLIFLIMMQIYKPLTGSLDPKCYYEQIRSRILKLNFDPQLFEINDMVIRLPRFFDRFALVMRSLKITQSIELYGLNWDLYEPFRPYAKGQISYKDTLKIFPRSKITLQNNNSGVGIHSRTLSAMASGGFILSHISERDHLPGGLKDVFEPGIHYGEFNNDNLEDTVDFWLSNDRKRAKVSKESRARVLADHTWLNRADEFKSAI